MFPVVVPRHSFFRVRGGIVHIRRYLIQRNMYHSRIGKILETKLLLFCWYQNSVHCSCCHLDFVRPCFPKMVALPHLHFSCLSSFLFSLYFFFFLCTFPFSPPFKVVTIQLALRNYFLTKCHWKKMETKADVEN